MGLHDKFENIEIKTNEYTLKSGTPITAHMNSNGQVTNMIFPIVLTATITH